LTSDYPSTDEETSTTDNILTSDDPSTDEETSTTDEGDNTTKMYTSLYGEILYCPGEYFGQCWFSGIITCIYLEQYKSRLVGLVLWCYSHFQQYFSYIVD
jgi:hypothetical protein